jgi:hypothetical protein
MLSVKMAHITKVTLYIYTHKFNRRIMFSSVKRTENLTERVSKIQFAEQRSSAISLTHHRITPNFRFGVDIKVSCTIFIKSGI